MILWIKIVEYLRSMPFFSWTTSLVRRGESFEASIMVSKSRGSADILLQAHKYSIQLPI